MSWIHSFCKSWSRTVEGCWNYCMQKQRAESHIFLCVCLFWWKITKFYRNKIELSPVVWRKNLRQKTSNVTFFRVTRWRFLKRWVSPRFSILSKWCLTLRESMKIERFFFFYGDTAISAPSLNGSITGVKNTMIQRVQRCYPL